MSISLTLDVAISLVFVYVLAALFASTLNEMIAGIFKLRGVYLTKGIEVLTSLGENNKFQWGGAEKWLAAHFTQSSNPAPKPVDTAATSALSAAEAAAAVAGANAASVRMAVNGVANITTLHPELIKAVNAVPPDAPAKDIMDLVRPAAAIATLRTHPLLVGTVTTLPSYVPARDFATALLSVLTNQSSTPTMANIEAVIGNLPDGDLKKTLLSFISAGADTLDKFRTRIENWFDDAMERLGGLYKRFNQYVMLILGLVIAVGMNVDSVHLARTLWTEPALSKAISDGAAQYVKVNQPSPDCKNTAGDGTTNTTGTAGKSCQKLDLKAIQDVIDQQNLPIGRKPGSDYFGCPGITQPDGTTKYDGACSGGEWKIWTMGGWIITAFAISLGAQFWFGVLTSLTNLRASGQKPKRADKT